jgi:thiamine biosynthesis lipoprotein ApbE
VVAGIVNVSGDINTWENNLMEKWKVAIKPMNKDKILPLFH